MKKLNEPVPKRNKEENVRTLKRLYAYVKGYKLILVSSIILTVLSNLANLVAPKLVETCINRIEMTFPKVDMSSVLSVALWMTIFYIGTYFLSIALSTNMLKLGQNIGYDLRQTAFEKFDKLPVSYFDTHQTGDVISRFTYDIDMISTSIGQTYVSFATSMITLIGSFAMMMTQNASLMLSFVITVPASIVFGTIMGNRTRVFNKVKSQKTGQLNGFIEDKMSGHKTIKVYSQEKNIRKQFLIRNKEWGESHYNSDAKGRGVLVSGTQFVTQTATILIYIHSAFLLRNGQITLAEIASFVLYSKMFTEIVNELSYLIADLQTSLATADRVFDLIDKPEEKNDDPSSIELKDVKGNVSIKHVDFMYNRDRKILNNISIEAMPNSTIAIVGHTGAGKTTLINLLMRFYHVNSGGISFDGHNIETLSKKSLRSACTMVLQETWLFNGSIYDNIAYGKEDTTFDEVIEVSKAVSLHDFVMTLPQKYDTIITEDSINISAGQKQLITIARAMLLDAQILILDEATSNVDSLTEIVVQNSMKKLMQNKTTFVIAHRLSTIKNADKILVFDKGEIVEHGTHDELLKLNKYYAELYKSQFDACSKY